MLLVKQTIRWLMGMNSTNELGRYNVFDAQKLSKLISNKLLHINTTKQIFQPYCGDTISRKRNRLFS